jgi:hypothetical protein
MKMNQVERLSVTIMILLLSSVLCLAQNRQNTKSLEGPYMGQTPPGNEPQIFALTFIGPGLHGCPVFTPDGMEAYWSLMSNMKMMYSKVIDGIWIDPVEIELPAEFTTSDVPCLTIDGNRLLFVSYAPTGTKENIWYMDRDGDGWTTPQLLSNTINENQLHWQISIAENGNLYFSYLGATGVDIAVSRFVDGQYTEVEALGPEINGPSLEQEFAPFIAPDESYLIFSYVDDGSSNPYADLFISFKNPNGSWTQAVPMEGLNADGTHEMCANVTRDGQYLFFLKDAEGAGTAPHWVSADVINNYRAIVCGDVDGNRMVDLLDIVYMIDNKFKDGPLPDPIESADVNDDGTFDILDIVHMIDFKFKECPPGAGMGTCPPPDCP